MWYLIASQRPTSTPSQTPQQQQQPGLPQGYPGTLTTATPPTSIPSYALPQPTNSGSLDLSAIKPVNTGSVSLQDALAKARGFAAEKGLAYDSGRGSTGTCMGSLCDRVYSKVSSILTTHRFERRFQVSRPFIPIAFTIADSTAAR
jgi:hypothetical protein